MGSHNEDGENLGFWLGKQRGLMNKGQLDTDKQKQMEDLGVVWDVLNQQWENNFNLLVKYNYRKGHCDVPSSHKEDGGNFGKWVATQRVMMNKGLLNVEKQMKLEDLGFVWDILQQQWENNFHLLVKYKD